MSSQTTHKFTLEEIIERKKKVQEEIQAQKKAMVNITQEIFTPVSPAVSRTSALMQSFNTGMAIFDGAMMGIKVMRKIRSYLKKLKS